MRIVESSTIAENIAPAFATEIYSGTALTVVERDGQELALCAFRRGSAKVSPDGTIVLRESADRGRSWADHHSPLDREGPGSTAPPGGLRQLAGPHVGSSAAGTVILGAALMSLARPGTPEYDRQAAGIIDAACVFVRADESGWSVPQVIAGRRSDSEWAIPCGPPVSLGDGVWLAPAERHATTRVPEWLRQYHAFSFRSVDDGRTWVDHGPMLNDPAREWVYYDQHVVVLGDGRVLSIAWTHDVIHDETITARAAVSDDGGATWSPAWDTGLLGGPVAAVRLTDGRLLAVYPRRSDPASIRACISTDEGRTWDVENEFVLWDERSRSVVGQTVSSSAPTDTPPLWDTMWAWSFGLPTPALFRDGSVGVAFYATGADGLSRVLYVRVEP